MDKLYIIHSLANPSDYPDALVRDDQSVELLWFCVDRPQPIAAYASLIRDYTLLEAPYRLDAQHFMDEHFTREEAEILLPYLCFTYGHMVGVGHLPIPMDIWVAPGQSMATPASGMLANGTWRIEHTLAPGDAGYPLPLKVCAYSFRNSMAEKLAAGSEGNTMGGAY